MSGSPFFPRFEQLGSTVPVFPLPGVLLLPRGLLPLNIFEPRYIAMFDDALASDRMIGMVQPVEQAGADPVPELYRVGCAGRITSFDETDDGRYVVTLTGICRFRVGEELPIGRGYRRVRSDWSEFAGDLEPGPVRIDRPRFMGALSGYFRKHAIEANWEAIEDTPDERLVTSLAMICPFAPSEKQALLEATTVDRRAEMMIGLMEMAVLGQQGNDGARH